MTRTSSFDKGRRAQSGQGSTSPQPTRSFLFRLLPIVIITLAITGLILPHVLIGGVRLFFSIPGYLLLGAAAILVAFVPFRRLSLGAPLLPVACALLFGGYLIVRTYTSPIEYLARADRCMILGALLVYSLAAFYFTSPKQRLTILSAMFIVGAADVASGLVQFFRNDNSMFLASLPDGWHIPQIFRPDYGNRASGFLGCPNHLAGFLETLGLIGLGLTCLARCRAVTRLIFGAFTAAAFVGLAFTGSRGGYLSSATGITVFLALLVWIIRKLRPKRFLLTVMIALITATTVVTSAILLMSSNVLLSGRMSNVIDTSDVRSGMWAAAIQQFHLAPVLGTGSGTYLYYGRQFRPDTMQADPVHAHSDYLELLAEYGVMGASLAALFLITHLHSGFRALTRISRKRLRPAKRLFSTEVALIASVIAAVVTLMAHSVVDFNGHIPSNTLFFAFLFGMLACPSADPQMTGTRSSAALRAGRIVLPIVGVSTVALTLPLFAGEYCAEWARVQLRCKEYVDVSSGLLQRIARALPSVAAGQIFPMDSMDRSWPTLIARDHLIPRAVSFAELGIQREASNPDLFFYLGEARHFEGVLSSDAAKKQDRFAAAAESCERALALFPMDVRILQSLGRAYENLGMPSRAESVLAKAIAADPKLGNGYAHYGFHLWKQKKLYRAEAYYRKALSLDGGSRLAHAGLRDIERVRAFSSDPQHVELFGDPLESFDLEPPNEEDERRGVRLDE